MTREDILTYADYLVDPTISDDDLNKIVEAVKVQLASILCLETFPDEPSTNLLILLANAVAFFLSNRGLAGNTQAESIRSYSYTIKNDAPENLTAYLSQKYGDLMNLESKCIDFGFKVSSRGGHEYRGGCCGRI